MYHTIQNISERVGIKNIHEVRQEGKSVTIQLIGGTEQHDCRFCKAGHRLSPTVAPRIKIKSF